MKAVTTFSRLMARCCFCPFEVRIVSRSEAGLLVEVERPQQIPDRLGAHSALEVDPEAVRRAEPVLELAEEELVVDDLLWSELAKASPGLLEATHRLDAGVAGVFPTGFDVEIHLSHLERPGDDGVEVFLLHPALGLEAEIVGELADLIRSLRRESVDKLAKQSVSESACLLQVLLVDPGDELSVIALEIGAGEQRLEHLVDVLADRTLLRAGGLVRLGHEWRERIAYLNGSLADGVELAGSEITVVTDRRLSNELPDLLRVFCRHLGRDVHEDAADELPSLVGWRQCLLLGPGEKSACPELVVLVEVLLLALREEVTTTGQPLLECGQRLVTIDVDSLGLGPNLVLEICEICGPLLVVDLRDDGRGKVQNLLELLRRDVQEIPDPARNALEEPDVRDGGCQVDVTHAFAAHLLARDLDPATFADDALVADALVLAAIALPVLRRTEDALAEQSVFLRLERAVIDRLRLRDLSGRPVSNLLRGREPDPDRVEVVDIDQRDPFYSSSSMSARSGASVSGWPSSSSSSLIAGAPFRSSTSPRSSSAGRASSPVSSARS